MDAPERIWANTAIWANGEPLAGEWNYRDVGSADDTPFTRADLCADPAMLAEAVEVLRWIAETPAHHAGQTANEYHMQQRARAFIAKLEARHDDN